MIDLVIISGVWWLNGKLGAMRPEGRRFEFLSCRYVGTLGKSLTTICL